jgi:chemotaxis regulatin CheY-phosphate phosphatase CheZ
VLAGAFADGAVEVATFVVGAVVVALLLGMARFMLHVRDSVRDQDKVLAGIDKAVNHTPTGEPRLYDLVSEVSAQASEAAVAASEAARTMRIMRGTVERHLRDDEERFSRNDVVLDEVRGVVIDLRDNLETTSARVEDLNEKVISLSVTVEALSSE